MSIVDILEWINPTFWVVANLALVYIGVLLLAFTILYPTSDKLAHDSSEVLMSCV